MAETIYYNGKKYNSVAEMPSSVRQKYEKFNRLFADANQDGIPDFVQPGGISGLKETLDLLKEIGQLGAQEGIDPNEVIIVRETDTGIYVNGRSFKNVSDMPSEIRKAYEKATNTADEGDLNIFDEAWREVEREEFFKPHDDELLNRQMTEFSQATNDSIEPVESTSRFILLAAAVILIFGSVAIVWFILF